ncbi:MAG: hypothetical protein KA163_09210 [Bacteroidia bacterium]|nr:hypothetical protein [Bacteroidia bacterium]
MKRISFIILFVILSQLLLARKDSARFTNFHGFYFNTYYSHYLNIYYASYSKYDNSYNSLFEIKPYKYQTPAVGIGYILNYKGLFLKLDLNYWNGTKALDDYFSFNSEDKNARDPYKSFSAVGNQYPSVGYRYYKVKDHYSGLINLHYFDFGLVFTGNITRFLRIYSGIRASFLMKEKYKATIDRKASLYEVKRYVSQYNRVDSLIEEENIQYKNDDAARKSVQTFDGYLFYNIGVNANFRIKRQLFCADLVFETNHWLPLSGGVLAYGITFKLSYVFKYSTDFGD